MALTDGLQNFWAMDESSDGSTPVTRVDSVGGLDLSAYNNVPSTTGLQYALAADLSASTNHAFTRGQDDDSLDLTGDIDVTWMVWVKLKSKTASQHFLAKGDFGDESYHLSYDQSTDKFLFVACEGSGGTGAREVYASTLGSPSTGTWYCVFCWRDSSDNLLRIAVNGGGADASSAHANGWNSSDQFLIGVRAGLGQWADAVIGPVARWNRVLTSDERTSLYNSGDGLTLAEMGSATPISVVQHDEGYYLVGSVTPTFDAAVTNGNAIAMLVCQYGGGGDVSVTEPLYNGTISLVAQSSDGKVKLFFKRNLTGGFTSVNLTFTDPSASYIMQWWELADVDASANVEYTTKDETAATSHAMGTSMTGSGFFVGGTRLGATATGTAGSGWAGHPPAAENAFLQYKIEDGVGETSPFTVDTSVTSTAMLALIPGVGTGPSTPTIGLPFLASTFTVYPPSKVSHVTHFPRRVRLVRR